MKQLLKHYRDLFPYKISLSDLTLHLVDGYRVDILGRIRELIEERERSRGSRRHSAPVVSPHERLFVKTASIGGLRSRVRVTLGRQRRRGGFDWLVAEFLNSVEARMRGVPMPRVKGIGYRRASSGLIKEVFLVSELLDGYVDGLEWLRRPGTDREVFLRRAFALMRLLYEKEVHHLDLWVGNLMVAVHEPQVLKVIDLENCYIGPTAYPEELLGFQFGFLYWRYVRDMVEESRYDALVQEALEAYGPLDEERFRRVYQVCKHQLTRRKVRHRLLHEGVLILD